MGFKELIDFSKARSDYLNIMHPLGRFEFIGISDSVGRILANDIKTQFPLPYFNKALMDGYAVKSADTFGAGIETPKLLKIVGSIEIGVNSKIKLGAGEAIRIATGAMLPDGADAVVKIEDTEPVENNEKIKVFKPVSPGGNVMHVGEDYPAGRVVLSSGHQVTPQDVGLLANLGYKKLRVATKPRIAIFTTGNELMSLEDFTEQEMGNINHADLAPGKILDSNRYLIQALVEWGGGLVADVKHLKDDVDLIKDTLDSAISSVDIMIFSGGTSVGEKDMMPVVIHQYHQVIHHGIAIRPGSATLLGRTKVQGKPILCVSGFPVAAEVAMLSFGVPAIRKLMGASILDPRVIVPARLGRAVPSKGFGIRRMLRVKLTWDNSGPGELPVADPVKLSGSSAQRSIVESDGFVTIPENCEGYEAGTIVNVRIHPH
ncbi:MAG: molybdopterin molybdotransferase MoeA [Promethearchaeota archaeon]